MKKLTVFVAGVLLATPALAQSSQAPTGGTAVPAEKPQMCEMMHNGMKMQGMMVKGEDGKMTCRMMDKSQMDHGMMDHSQMNHGMMDHSQMGHGQTTSPAPKSAPGSEAPPADPAAQDHSAHPGHGPG